MYRFYLNGIQNEYHMEELAREFLAEEEFEILPVTFQAGAELHLTNKSYLLNSDCNLDFDGVKRELYRILSEETGLSPEWGTLTGVRPLKLAFSHYDDLQDVNRTMDVMAERYLLQPSKVRLLREIMEYQLGNLHRPTSDGVSLYVHIPFCPTRCSYCSFATNVAPEEDISGYFDYLIKEIKHTGELFRKEAQQVESVYIGGGTPTTLSDNQLAQLVDTIREAFDLNMDSVEFTVEAGRPDTISLSKMKTLREAGVNRISINPQSMREKTLDAIGRSHSPEDIRTAFAQAAQVDFKVINSDVIAGLPGENLKDFRNTLQTLVRLGANNITVHTLSVKRGSKLKEEDPEYYRRNTETVKEMLRYSEEYLKEQGFIPYYIYRQKHQMGSFENVGYCKPGAHSVYNVRIMEEKQTIIGMGAGAIGKRYFPEQDRLERIPNVGNYMIYEERFDEMLLRKNNYWGGKNGD